MYYSRNNFVKDVDYSDLNTFIVERQSSFKITGVQHSAYTTKDLKSNVE